MTAEDAEDKAERSFDHLCADLARTPAMNIAEEDLDAYVRGTTARLATGSRHLPEPQTKKLTAEELLVLACISRGMTEGMAGEACGISASLAADRMKTARFKLRAKNAAHACSEAIRQGLIP